jgi:hypothetical protein
MTDAGDPSGAPRPSAPPPRDRFSNVPAVEVELVHEVRAPPTVDRPWRMLEVWTENSIYGVDATMRCIEVLSATTRQPVADHSMLGARLVGGQFVENDRVTHLSHPFPRPGTEAVFERTNKDVASFSHTSPVTRVVLRLRHLTIAADATAPSWDEIAPPRSREG